MTGKEFVEFLEDLRVNGQREPIVVYDGMILDGRNRARACEILGIAPRQVEWSGDGSPFDFVWSLNASRRHLSQDTKAACYLLYRAGRTNWLEEQADAVREANKTRASKASNQPRDRHGRFGRRTTGDVHQCARSAGNPSTWGRVRLANAVGCSERTAAKVLSLFNHHYELFEKVAASKLSANKALTQARQAQVENHAKLLMLGQLSASCSLFEVVVVDPPWPYGTTYNPDGRRCASPYPEMTMAEISSLRIPAAEDCVLWLWTTHRFLRDAYPLLDKWGFREVSVLTWVKNRIGTGFWLRSKTEFCIMAVRGNPRINLKNQTTVIYGRGREHSRKPEEFYNLVESLCLGTKIEMFARTRRAGWESWGDQIDHYDAED